MQTEIKIGNKTYRVDISELPENLLKVRVNDKDYFLTKSTDGELVFLEDFKPPFKENGVILEGLAEKEIKSPISGTISAIYVKKGEKIKPGQKVITLISMKMENEIISESFGQVEEIKVKENQFVNINDTLIILE